MVYKIQESFDYYSSGCDCCEPDKMESYTIFENGVALVLEEDGVEYPLSFAWKEDALDYLLRKHGIEVEYTYEGED